MGKRIRRICIISQGYPTDQQPSFPFVDQLVCAFTEQNVECIVICPQSITKAIIYPSAKRPVYWEKNVKDKKIKIYQPYMLTMSNLSISRKNIVDSTFERAVIKCFKKMRTHFDVIYGHFWKCGLIAAKIGYKYHIPSFVACGESIIPYTSLSRNLKYKDNLNGVICVSTKSKDESISLGLCSEKKTIVCPNAINNQLFCEGDKLELRRKYGIDVDIFIIAFVGGFNARKGSRRVSEALDQMDGIYSFFIGSGNEIPTCKNRLFTGSLPHDKVPTYLQMADAFVLPTFNEGCCNAVVEAMACGLPIISSDLPFNYDILDETNAIMIDPQNISEIIEAIETIRTDLDKCLLMRKSSLSKASMLTISNRAKKIIQFMEGMIK